MHCNTAFLAASLCAFTALAKTITVEVGNGGLTFSPASIAAAKGDVVEFEFYPLNHAVAQSDFASPCTPVNGGVYSGFVPSSNGAASEHFLLTVNNTDPIWLYCPQIDHCLSGMVAVINPPSGSDQTLQKFTMAATSASTNTAPTGPVSGGILSTGDGSTVASFNSSTASVPTSTAAPKASGPNLSTILTVHGVLAGLTFLIFLPIGALSLHLLPSSPSLVWVHASAQLFAYCLALVVLGTGIWQGKTLGLLGAKNGHPVIGMIIIVLLTLQPVGGLLHHAKYMKTGGRTLFGMVHKWMGRVILLLGAVNGGLGLMLAKNSPNGKIAWGVIAGVVGSIYVIIVAMTWRKGNNTAVGEKAAERNVATGSETGEGPVP